MKQKDRQDRSWAIWLVVPAGLDLRCRWLRLQWARPQGREPGAARAVSIVHHVEEATYVHVHGTAAAVGRASSGRDGTDTPAGNARALQLPLVPAYIEEVEATLPPPALPMLVHPLKTYYACSFSLHSI